MKTDSINWKASKVDSRVIGEITHRAANMIGRNADYMSIRMDITACHLNGCPLDLYKLLEADDFNFAHDVIGITRHINRDTGQLENCFVPRFAAK